MSHFQDPFQQHPRALTWRSACSCGFRGHWRGSPDRAQDDFISHVGGDDSGGIAAARLRGLTTSSEEETA
jgi:hypothetical protein